ncbi:MAG: citrate synthase [Candidatus Methylacidiphilales bacterium]
MSDSNALLRLHSKEISLPVLTGSEGEQAIDIRRVRDQTGFICYDDGYANTGSCQSAITFIDGDRGILRYRGYPVEQLAEHSNFLEVAYLLIHGELPTASELQRFRKRILGNAAIQQSMLHHFSGFPNHSHPMAMLSAMVNSLGCFYPELASNDRARELAHFEEAACILISKVRTLAAMSYRMKRDKPFIHPKTNVSYCSNFLHMMFSEPYAEYIAREEVDRALNLILLLHADHEQNCSTSTVRMVASGGANLFASAAAGICALWGPAHGGANQAVLEMLQTIHDEGDDGTKFIEAAKSGDKQKRLMGFGHRVYKNYDPRAKILKKQCEEVLDALGLNDPLLDIALRLEEAALRDDYFLSRKLYPNVDFYSGIIMRAIGIPVYMFTVMFAIGRMPGWLAHWKELAESKSPIHRPRQIYTGPTVRDFVPIEERPER